MTYVRKKTKPNASVATVAYHLWSLTPNGANKKRFCCNFCENLIVLSSLFWILFRVLADYVREKKLSQFSRRRKEIIFF